MSSNQVVTDRHQRPLGSLRISVTDRCNLRCTYCMPEEEYVWLPRAEILSFEEIEVLVDAFTRLGVHRVRLTGGEPLLRRDLDRLVSRLAQNSRIDDIALTTNALLLPEQAQRLRHAGLQRVTVSLDSLQRERYCKLTGRDDLERALAGIEAARTTGFDSIKMNTVVMRGENEDELIDLCEYAFERGIEPRLIEYMDVGGATQWSPEQVVSRREMLDVLQAHFGTLTPAKTSAAAPAERFQVAGGHKLGIIASTTEPFCGACDRSRITADGTWYLCLYARIGINLAKLVRGELSVEEIAQHIRDGWSERSDRGALERLSEADRGALAARSELRRDPRLEMHTRGG